MGTEWNYYLLRFAVGPFKYFVRAITVLGNLIMSKLDRGFLRDERFTWEYIVVARKREERAL